MTIDLDQRLEACIAGIRQGKADEAAIRGLFADARAADRDRRQCLLYVQASHTHVASPILGMGLVAHDGRQLPSDPARWPYGSVLEAMADGWRIISFPDLGRLGDPLRPVGLGCEFILEKWQ